MAKKGFVLSLSIVSILASLSSLSQDILLLTSSEWPILRTITNFQLILLFFLSTVAIGLYHYWEEERVFFYLPRYYLIIFFIGLVGSIFLVNVPSSVNFNLLLTFSSMGMALGLLGLAAYNLQITITKYS